MWYSSVTSDTPDGMNWPLAKKDFIYGLVTEGVIPGVVVSTTENELTADWLVKAVVPSAEEGEKLLPWIPTADIQLNVNQFCHYFQ